MISSVVAAETTGPGLEGGAGGGGAAPLVLAGGLVALGGGDVVMLALLLLVVAVAVLVSAVVGLGVAGGVETGTGVLTSTGVGVVTLGFVAAAEGDVVEGAGEGDVVDGAGGPGAAVVEDTLGVVAAESPPTGADGGLDVTGSSARASPTIRSATTTVTRTNPS